MERVNLGYSIKNIPLANERSYKLQLVEKIEALIKKMRWKVILYKTQNENKDMKRETFGLKTANCPTQVKELIPFENDLIQMAKDIKFRRTRSEFQDRMKSDIQNIRNSEKTLTPADKTTNMYKLTKDQYAQLKQNAVTTKYKKANNNIKEKVDKTGMQFANKAGVLDRMPVNGTNSCFITLKDHKDNFTNNPTTRLINPAKNEIGRISKVILDKINVDLKNKLRVNQWKNTKSVIEWFKGISDKTAHTFTMFDIKDFYPSIKENLLKEAINFAKTHITLSKNDIEVIFHARKSLLFSNGDTWIKKEDGLFDVTMGAYDGAEVCELVGAFLLSLIGEKYEKKDIGLYRDDGLAVFKNTSGPMNERIKKDFVKIFKEKGLDIVILCNQKIVDYLDVTLNLNDGSFRPYRKPDNETNYIHKESDHPPNIIQQLPISVEERISSLSSSEQIFNQSKQYYQDALTKSGYNHVLKYKPAAEKRRRTRQRKIIWFNPPYSKVVVTNVGSKFLSLIQKHFPPHHKLRKLFNKNNVKISYGCMPNIGATINAHNKKILKESSILERGKCNCARKERCPLNGECLTKCLVYKAKINANLRNYSEKVYYGITKNTWKKRYAGHKSSFNNLKYQKDTELSKEVWGIRNKSGLYNLNWQIVSQHPDYNPVSKRCLLCLNEKLEILYHEGNNQLNKRSEIVSKCRHQRDHMLSKFRCELSDVR